MQATTCHAAGVCMCEGLAGCSRDRRSPDLVGVFTDIHVCDQHAPLCSQQFQDLFAAILPPPHRTVISQGENFAPRVMQQSRRGAGIWSHIPFKEYPFMLFKNVSILDMFLNFSVPQLSCDKLRRTALIL